MPQIEFTPNLQRHIDCPITQVEGGTVRDALEQLFQDNPKLRGYVLDDQGRLRRHVVVFVDAESIRDRQGLSDAVRPDSAIYVVQALSGG